MRALCEAWQQGASRDHLINLLRGSFDEGDIVGNSPSSDWKEVLRLAQQQGVVAMSFVGVSQLREDQRPPVEIYLEWLGLSDIVHRKSIEQFETAARLAAFWKKHGIRTVVIKGISNAVLYPRPTFRPASDFDCFLCGQYEDGNKCIESLGYSVGRSDYRHAVFNFENLHVENHRFCTTIRGDKQRKLFEKRLQSLLIDATPVKVQGTQIELPPLLFRALYFLQHAHRHFLREGITLRYICDWAMIIKAGKNSNLDNVFNDDFWEECKKNDLLPFAETMTRLACFVCGVSPSWQVGQVHLTQIDLRVVDDCFGFHKNAVKYGNGFFAHIQIAMNIMKNGWKFRHFSQYSNFRYLISSIVSLFFEKKPMLS